MQEQIILACTACKRHNYYSAKNKRNVSGRIELNKFCKFCRKHTVHKEKK